MDEIERYLEFGHMALEQGWYDQAHDYFEQALALDVSNREAMKGLARANEILSRREAIVPTKPDVPVAKPAQPARPRRAGEPTAKREGKKRWLALAVVIPVLLLILSVAYQRVQVAQREATPTPRVDYAQVYETQAAQREATRVAESTSTPKPWPPTATPKPPTATPKPKSLTSTPKPPTATPGISAEEEAYLSQFYEIIGIYEDSSHDFALLEQEIFSGFQLGGITGWDSRWRDVDEMVRQTGERVQGLEVPARYERVHQELEQASQHVQGASNALLTGARRQDYLISVNRTCTMDESCRLNIKQARQGLESASECIVQATKKLEQLTLPAAIPPAPTPEISYEEAAYLLAVQDIPDCFANAEVELKLLIQEAGLNPYIRGDRSFQKDVAAADAAFYGCSRRLEGLDPPPRLADVHDDLVRCGYFCLNALDNYMFGIEELLPEAIEEGDKRMQEAADCFGRVFDEIDEIFGL